jgi:amino-acid N-acetyltransferase
MEELSVTIAPAKLSEAAAIRELLTASALPTSDLTPPLLDKFFVCRAGSSLVGTIGLEFKGDDALLRSLAVSPSHRGKGLGAELVRRVESHAVARGVKALYLLTTTAERFFAGRGYGVISREAAPEEIRGTAEFSTLCPSTSVCMMKRLRELGAL